MFDPSTFMNQKVAGPMATTLPVCPEGDFTARLDDSEKFVEFKEAKTKNGPRPIMTLWYNVLDEGVRTALKRDAVRVKQDIWLDIDSNGNIETGEGKNVDLGRLRAALGQNTGSDWNPSQLKGAGPLMVHIGHESTEKGTYAKVTRTTKLS